MAWAHGTSSNVPWWTEDISLAEQFHWTLEYVSSLPPWWRARIRLWNVAKAEAQEVQSRKAARKK